jgi:hypothetical protein
MTESASSCMLLQFRYILVPLALVSGCEELSSEAMESRPCSAVLACIMLHM